MSKYKEFCPVCGLVNLDDLPKCFRCGEPLTRPGKAAPPKPAPTPPKPSAKRPR